MLFKNVQLFRLCEDFPLNAEELDQRLQEKQAKPCHKMALFSYGWVSPFGDESEVLVHSCNGYMLVKARKEEKILPASVINENWLDKINQVETAQDRRLSTKEKKSMKEDVIFELLPQAFTRKVYTHAYIDTKSNCLVVDTSSHSNAEDLITLMRDSIMRFDLRPPETKNNPASAMTDWLLNDSITSPFELADNCEMIDPKSAAVIKCQRHELQAKTIRSHLREGKQVTKLGICWDEKIKFTLHEDMSLKGIKYLDLYKEQLEEVTIETKAQQIDADFALMSGELSHVIKSLIKECGGWQRMSKLKTEEVDEVEEVNEE